MTSDAPGPALRSAVERLSRAEMLLVCVDLDGTLAEFNADPYAVRPHPVALDAIRTLVALPGTRVAILTGRHLAGLARVIPESTELAGLVRVGSHGAEPGPTLAPADAAYLDRIGEALTRIATPPAYVEVKPYQRVLHVAPLAEEDPARARALLDAALTLATDSHPVTPGHNVVEFSAVDITKGSWLAEYKRDFAATLFAGDDTTDETALRVLDQGGAGVAGPDVGVKVGAQESVAHHRVADVAAMAQLLSELAARRRSFLAETS